MGDKQNLAKESQLALKQDKLIAGANITIALDGKTISATGGNTVTISPTLISGTKIADVVVDTVPMSLYAPAGGSQSLAGLTDVNITSPTDRQALVWDYGNQIWINGEAGLSLPENWELNENMLTVQTPLNELGWGVKDNTYYFDTTATFSIGDRDYTKDNSKPCLGAIIGNPLTNDKPIVLVSTDSTATHYTTQTPYGTYYNRQDYTTTYQGVTWYYSGGSANYHGTPNDIEVINDMTLEQAALYLIQQSQIYTVGMYSGMAHSNNTYTFFSGGNQSDASDATFKTEPNGIVHGTDFKINNTSILNAFTGSDGTNAGVKGMVPAPSATDNLKFLRGDGTWAEAGGGGGGGGSYSETTLWSGNETPTTSGMDITLSGNISDYDLLVIYTYDPNNNYGGDNFYLVDDLTIGDLYISTIYAGNSLGAYWTYTSDTSINIKRQASAWPVTYTSIKGIKFGGGNGNNHTYSTTEHTIGTWTDGSTLYEKTYEIDVLSPASTYTQNISIPNMNIIEIVKHYANYLYNGTWYYLSGDSLYYNNGSYLHLQYDGELQGTLALSANLGAVSEIKLCFTLRYTKSSSS